MSSRAHTDAARLRRLRRIGHRLGLSILAARKGIGGGYMVSNEAERKVLLGDRPVKYSADLDAVEAFLEAAAAQSGQGGGASD